MRYVGSVVEGVIVSKGIAYTDYVDEREIELTEKQYNSIPIPCKRVNGEFIPCDYPVVTMPEIKKEPSAEDDINAMLVDHEYRLTMIELGVN